MINVNHNEAIHGQGFDKIDSKSNIQEDLINTKQQEVQNHTDIVHKNSNERSKLVEPDSKTKVEENKASGAEINTNIPLKQKPNSIDIEDSLQVLKTKVVVDEPKTRNNVISYEPSTL